MFSLISLELPLDCSLATMAAVKIVSILLSEVGGALGGLSVEDISKLLSEVGGASGGSSVEDISLLVGGDVLGPRGYSSSFRLPLQETRFNEFKLLSLMSRSCFLAIFHHVDDEDGQDVGQEHEDLAHLYRPADGLATPQGLQVSQELAGRVLCHLCYFDQFCEVH